MFDAATVPPTPEHIPPQLSAVVLGMLAHINEHHPEFVYFEEPESAQQLTPFVVSLAYDDDLETFSTVACVSPAQEILRAPFGLHLEHLYQNERDIAGLAFVASGWGVETVPDEPIPQPSRAANRFRILTINVIAYPEEWALSRTATTLQYRADLAEWAWIHSSDQDVHGVAADMLKFSLDCYGEWLNEPV